MSNHRRAIPHSSADLIYQFAKPIHAHHKHGFLKPTLVTQFQRVGRGGRLEGTFDVFSVNFLTSIKVKEVRQFPRRGRCSPTFVVAGDRFPDEEDSRNYDSKPPSETATGAAAGYQKTTGESSAKMGMFASGTLSCTLDRNADGTYNMLVDDTLVGQWQPQKLQEETLSFTLTGTGKEAVIARLEKDSLVVNRVRTLYGLFGKHVSSFSNNGDLVSSELENVTLLMGGWIAYHEGWVS
ncbi:hypothetical protein FDECE_13076 [Fusarium decemcellulare]|nr:hypothetical protein FDECE_13076 [Fusarium decemcellulare]